MAVFWVVALCNLAEVNLFSEVLAAFIIMEIDNGGRKRL
jgi:hypothetical protein